MEEEASKKNTKHLKGVEKSEVIEMEMEIL